MLPGWTSATRAVNPAGGDGPSQNIAGPSPAHASATAAATARAAMARFKITIAMAVFDPAIRKLVSQTPPSEAEASAAGWFHCDAPSNAHGPPRLGNDRTASAVTQALGNTSTAASVPRAEIGSPR